jgi:hypothetical protein
LGGVTFTGYLRVALVLANTILLSTALGLLVSSWSRDSTRAIVTTLLLMIALSGGPVLLDVVAGSPPPFEPVTSFASPGYALYVAGNSGAPGLWTSLGIQHTLVWVALLCAALKTARLADEPPVVRRSKTVRWLGGEARKPGQARLRDRAPIVWITQRGVRGPTIISLLALISFVILTGFKGVSNPTGFPNASQFMVPICYLVLLLWLIVLATRRTGEGRRDGEFELLLAAPIGSRKLVNGLWRGLVRLFLLPTVLLALMMIATSFIQYLNLVRGWANTPGLAGSNQIWIFTWQMGINAFFGMIGIFTTMAAAAWVGLWFGLTGEKNSTAAARTFLIAIVAPAVLLGAIQIAISLAGIFNTAANSQFWQLAQMAVRGVVALALDLVFIFWARQRLRTHFRAAANGTLGKLRWFSISKLRALPVAAPD